MDDDERESGGTNLADDVPGCTSATRDLRRQHGSAWTQSHGCRGHRHCIEEAREGFTTSINSDGNLTIQDDGRGIPGTIDEQLSGVLDET